MDVQHFFGVHLLLSIQGILILAGVGTCSHIPFSNKESSRNFIGCFPCFQNYLVKSCSKEHDRFNSDFHELFYQELCSLKSCKGLVHNTGSVLSVSALQRRLIGEGSHRRLLSSVEFEVHSDAISKLSSQVCKIVAVERLPSGVFADPFELQHLVQRSVEPVYKWQTNNILSSLNLILSCHINWCREKVFADASAFGDTNLELPSALSNRSVIEVHMDVNHKLLAQHEKDLTISIDLPLHARYPPLDARGNGYSTVEMGMPHLFLLCKMEESEHEDCLWTSVTWNAESASNGDNIWYIPCGNPTHAGIVSTVTFLSAIVSAVSIIFTAIYSSHEIKLYQYN